MPMRAEITRGNEEMNTIVKGDRFEADLDGQTVRNISFAENREIFGASMEVVNFTPGDYVEMFITLPNDAEVGQLAETLYIPPSGGFGIEANSTIEIPAGLKIRVEYNCVKTSGDKPDVYIEYLLKK